MNKIRAGGWRLGVLGGIACLALILAAGCEASRTIGTSSNPAAGGTTSGAGTYKDTLYCTVTATPAAGYAFVNWTEGGTEASADAAYTFEVAANRTLVANFAVERTISTSPSPSAGGTTSGDGTYADGVNCNVTATPAAGYSFVNWTVGAEVSTDSDYTFVVSADRALVANFVPIDHTVQTSASPSAGGLTAGDGAYAQGSSCTVTAATSPGYTFVDWTEGVVQVSTDSSYTFPVTADTTLVANFAPTSRTIAASANPGAGGVITGAGAYDFDSTCDLTIVVDPAWGFINWTETATEVSTDADYSFTVTGNRTLVANFGLLRTITTVANPTEGTAIGDGSYAEGTECTVTATPEDGYAFANWNDGGGPVSTSATYTFTVSGDVTLTANFTALAYTVSLYENPVGSDGSVGHAPGNPYSYGVTCTATATDGTDYTFTAGVNSWTENGYVVSTDNPYIFDVERDYELVANFTYIGALLTFDITTSANPTDKGSTSGDGTFGKGTSQTVTATPYTGYMLESWTENGVVVCMTPDYTFSLEGNRTLVANFRAVSLSNGWENSGHADSTSEAFRHWDEDGAVSIGCAKCHSEGGFLDFVGEDGSAAGVVDAPAALGTVITCNVCHNDSAIALTSVTFPSGEQVTGLGGGESRCVQCHQGRESTVSVDEHIITAAVVDDDTSDTDLSFRNVHYFPAGATRFGGLAQGGYQYSGEPYATKFAHVAGYESCGECHNPHSLAIDVTKCATCHTGVSTLADLPDIRMEGSKATDFDGDGNVGEGLAAEVDGLRTLLYNGIQEYASHVIGTGILYSAADYPYWFIDTNDNGVADAGEIDYANSYKDVWTARLVKTTYNYQYSAKDPGGYAHNGKYVIQLLYDSIADLNVALLAASQPDIDISNAFRVSVAGHFDGSSEAFRHWDDDGAVSASCSKCHGGAEGFRAYVEHGVEIEVPFTDGLECATCHDSIAPQTTVAVNSVTFPSDITITDSGNLSNMCMTCHSGREAKATIDEKIAAGSYSFRNVHYLPAAAVLFGSNAQVGYEYDGKSYAGRSMHAGTVFPAAPNNNCVDCHSPVNTNHSFHIMDNFAICQACHIGAVAPTNIRITSFDDYDGDGSILEPLADEVTTLSDALLAEIETYAANTIGVPIVHTSSYPYWAKAAGGGYTDWDAKLMKAAHNFQISVKEHGAWAHNFDYIVQLLIDSVEDLGGDVSGYTRP